MTPFQTLLKATGFSHSEAAGFLNVSTDAIRSWACKRRKVPFDILESLVIPAKKNCGTTHEKIAILEERIKRVQTARARL